MQNSRSNEPCANMLEHFRSSLRAHPAVRLLPRYRAISIRWLVLALIVPCAAFTPGGVLAASPSPHPAASARPVRIDVTKVQPKSLLPKKPEHADYVVEINKLGQVTRITSRHSSASATFNSQTYGNALQTFIRTPDGHVVLGSYKLTYDFDPKTARVRRDVTLIRQGGVDPDAKGAALDMLDRAHIRPATGIAPGSASAIDPRTLPDLKGVIEPAPTPAPSPS
jgi:hypothetical protein